MTNSNYTFQICEGWIWEMDRSPSRSSQQHIGWPPMGHAVLRGSDWIHDDDFSIWHVFVSNYCTESHADYEDDRRHQCDCLMPEVCCQECKHVIRPYCPVSEGGGFEPFAIFIFIFLSSSKIHLVNLEPYHPEVCEGQEWQGACRSHHERGSQPRGLLRTRTRVVTRAGACRRVQARACVYASMRLCVYAYMRTFVHAYTRMYLFCVHVYMCICVMRICVHAHNTCICVYAIVYAHILCVYAYAYVFVYAYVS